MKLWAGRFSKEVDDTVNDFNSSISFDFRMYEQDIKGSMAHATMLFSQQILSKSDLDLILQGLSEILEDIKSGTLQVDFTAEDIHMFVESELTKRIGDAGKRLHTARSRNDQVALDTRMYAKAEIQELSELLKHLIIEIVQKAKEHTETIMPGYTHLQRAQPITFAHHLMAYCEMLTRDLKRLEYAYQSADVMPLGSGALATTTYDINRQQVCDLLNFQTITKNSLDGVSDRDFCLDTVYAISVLMMHLSRFSEEIILWCSWEFKFIELDDAYATGSSIMPQKKNPDIAELVRGKTGRTYGDLITLLTVMKGLPLAYNKDMQEDKEALFDSIDTAKMCLKTFAPMIKTMQVLKENMRLAAAKGFINATDCADYLTKKGLPFRDAYKVTGQIVAFCIKENKTLETLTLEEYKKHSDLFSEDIYDAISLDTCVTMRNVPSGPSPKMVAEHIQSVLKTLENY